MLFQAHPAPAPSKTSKEIGAKGLGLNLGSSPPKGRPTGPEGAGGPELPFVWVLHLFQTHCLASAAATEAGAEAPRSPVCGWEKAEPEKLLCALAGSSSQGSH